MFYSQLRKHKVSSTLSEGYDNFIHLFIWLLKPVKNEDTSKQEY